MTDPQTGTGGGSGTEGGHPQPASPPATLTTDSTTLTTDSTTSDGGSGTEGGHPQPAGEPTQ
jgi:hypothetical protein